MNYNIHFANRLSESMNYIDFKKEKNIKLVHYIINIINQIINL